jgi:hypothetical protein
MNKTTLAKSILIVLSIMAIASMGMAMSVCAEPYDYHVTSNWHGIDTPLGANVIVTATTTDPTITQVTFIWRNAADEVMWTHVVTMVGGSAESPAHSPNSPGDWGVQALFQGPDGKTKEGVELVVSTRATSFFVIPEIPIIGTAGASMAMFAGLAVKMRRKPKN